VVDGEEIHKTLGKGLSNKRKDHHRLKECHICLEITFQNDAQYYITN